MEGDIDSKEMEMRSKENIPISTDITSQLIPLSFSLHNTHLTTHCSSCFSLLKPPNKPHPPFYCSPNCSTAHSSIPLTSAEHHLPSSTSTSLLRTSLRLLLRLRFTSSSNRRGRRLNGLLSNRHLLTCRNDDDVCETIRVNAIAMAIAIAKRDGGGLSETVIEDATVALCVVLTNAVEVVDDDGCGIGIAVFEHSFSWINHSCSPNACYRFSFSSSSSSLHESKLLIAPFTQNSRQPQIDCEVYDSSSEFAREGRMICGPRLIVRSIKRIKKGEEVTIAYIDLFQPKALRQSELWSKYRFICCCKRCSSLPLSYADHALQEISVFYGDSSGLGSDYKLFKDMADRRLTDSIEDVISEYLSVGDSVSCCEKLEEILIEGLDFQLEGNERKAHSKFMLHPLHHLCLNSYTTLASAYKVRACDLLSLDSKTDLNLSEAFDMSRTSAAYFLLLAGAAHHLFNSESSLIASVANFWIGAGESLITLIRNSGWSKFVNFDLVHSNLDSDNKFECSKCSLTNRFRACTLNGQIKSEELENLSNEFIHCVSNITSKVWTFLVYGCHFLKSCKDPINFNWLTTSENETGYTHESENVTGVSERTYNDHTEAQILQLGAHCLTYGGLLACICYGPHSHLVSYVQNILDH